jgi:RNA polymerase sigma factor (sigma-70 family)
LQVNTLKGKKVTCLFKNYFFVVLGGNLGYKTAGLRINNGQVSNYYKEAELLKRLGNNEKAAIEAIYKDNYRLIQQLIVNNNGSEDDARDIFQEALIVLYQKAQDETFELNCQIKTYIYSICRRLWLKRLQQNRRFETPVDNFEEMVPVEEDVEVHLKQERQYGIMRSALGKIGEPCKSLLEAFYIHNKNMAEISSFFGYTNADNAKNQKYKCLMRLKKLFFAQYKNGN